MWAAPFQYHWDIRQLASADAETIDLRDRRNKPIAQISGSQMRILHAVKTSIEQVAEIETRLLIVDGTQPNAFAGVEKNGESIIGINFAMLDIIGNDVHAAAALIGHEIAHLKLAHGKKQAKKKHSSSILKAVGGIALSSMGVPLGYAISDLTISAFETQYSRDNEREADYLGAIWAVEAGYEADGGARLHEKMLENSKLRHNSSSFLSSHPSSAERVRTLRSLSERLSP